MIVKKLVADSRNVVERARKLASELDSPTLEAEHLLLAVAHQPATAAHRILAEAGLDYDQVRDALELEFEGSLAAVGVALGDFDLTSTAGKARVPRWGTSAKLALERSAKIAGARRDRHITPSHILLGILKAPTGPVPRALDGAGIDRAALSRRVAATI
jgi:ATP-dependent Clp protease ATP-binding subunit ClpA